MKPSRASSQPIRPSLVASLTRGKKHLIASSVLHLAVILALLFNWNSTKPIEPLHVPNHVKARVVSAEELDFLKQKKLNLEQQAQEKIKQQQAEKEKRALAEKKKAQAKEEARKIALLKQRQEKEKRQKLEQEKKKQAEARNKQKQLEQEKQQQERLVKEKRAREAEEKRQQREAELAARLAAIEQEERQLEQTEWLSEVEAQRQQARLARELEEKERYMALIQQKIENRWHVPPKVRKLSVVLRIRLLPNGELVAVDVSESSGHSALDQSALSAVRSAGRLPVPDDSAAFEKYFRTFIMRFTPPDS